MVVVAAALLGGALAASADPDTTPPEPTEQVVPSEIEVGQNVAMVGSATDGGMNVTNPNLFNWTFEYNGSEVTLHGQTASFRFWAAGTYPITLQVDDAAGNRAWTNETITVREKAPAPAPASTSASGKTPGFEAVAAAAALAAVGVIGVRARARR